MMIVKLGFIKREIIGLKGCFIEIERLRISSIRLILNSFHNSLSLKRVIYLFLVFS